MRCANKPVLRRLTLLLVAWLFYYLGTTPLLGEMVLSYWALPLMAIIGIISGTIYVIKWVACGNQNKPTPEEI